MPASRDRKRRHDARSLSKALACFSSSVSNPSVKPAIDGCEQIAGDPEIALVASETGEAGGCAQFE